MEHSRDRILTTHVGSLPRPAALLELLDAAGRGEALDPARWGREVRAAVTDSVARQLELGLDVVADGEMSKPSFLTYISTRLGGFEPDPTAASGNPFAGSREELEFPDYYQNAGASARALAAVHMVCTSPITYIGQDAVHADIANLQAALGEDGAHDAFIPAISPGNVEGWHRNGYYATEEEFLFAIADALHEEYRAITDCGFLLQIDDPRLVTYYALTPGASVEDCRRWAAVRVEAINHALRGIPRDRVRFHTCYSIDMGPRVNDMNLRDVVDLILSVHAGAYSFEAANPRHEHEWRVWEDVQLPEDAVLIPGVVTQSTVLVEHPELVADRLERFASVVGRERVIAGADCGFGTFAGATHMPSSVAWAKLGAIVEGARIASKRLWR